MPLTAPVVRLHGLSALEELELGSSLPATDVSFEHESLEGARHGELFTAVAVVTISIAALIALSAWLLKTRTHDVIERSVEIVQPDGTRRTETLRIDLRGSSAPSAEVIQKLGQAVGAPSSTISAALNQIEAGPQPT